MDGVQCLDSFYFDYYAFFDKHVEFESAVYAFAFVNQWNLLFSFDPEPTPSEFNGQTVLVYRFK